MGLETATGQLPDSAAGAKIGTERVGGIKIGTEVVWRGITIFEWSGAGRKTASGIFVCPAPSDRKLPTEWVAGGGDAYLRLSGIYVYPIINRNGQVQLQLDATSTHTQTLIGPHLTDEAERGLRMEFIHATAGTLTIIGTGSDTEEPYVWTPSNTAEIRAWVNAYRDQNTVTVRLSL